MTSSLGGSRGVNLDKTQDYNQQSNHNDNLGSLSGALHKGKSMPSLRWGCNIEQDNNVSSMSVPLL